MATHPPLIGTPSRPPPREPALYPLELLTAPTMAHVTRAELLGDHRQVAALLLLRRRLQRRTRAWVHPINQRRQEQGAYYHLVQELQLDATRFHQYFRMTAGQMEEVLLHIGEDITKCTTNFREPIEPKQKLAVTLRYLASGDSIIGLAYSYRLGVTTVREAIFMTCTAINRRMMKEYIPKPTEAGWKEIAQKFQERWNFPLCIGALDGKHIQVRAPPNTGSLYFNYKGTFSVVLMALVDAEYRFRVVHIGEYGRNSDGGIFAKSGLGRRLAAKTLEVPNNEVVPGAEDLGALADAAFPLKPYLMRPYPGRDLSRNQQIFNYRLSRARNVVENAFGILTSRWRILLHALHLSPERVNVLVLTACILHNFLLNPREDQQWLDDLEATHARLGDLENMRGNRGSNDAYKVRDTLAAYFVCPEGSVPWQDRMI